VKFAAFSLVINAPDPLTGVTPGQHERLEQLLTLADFVEDAGYDAFQVGERHGAPLLSSSPVALLSAIAARTRRIRLLTGVTVLSIHDPVRIAEDYATLDHLSGGRLDLVIAKGNHAAHYPLFGLDPAEQWDVLAEKYELLRRLWSEEEVSWTGRHRSPLDRVTTQPRPYQQHIQVWHGSATSTESVELAARHGDPLYSANGFFLTQQYQDLIDLYRERWVHHGHAGEPLVAAGFPVLLIARTSQEARDAYRPYWDAIVNSPIARPGFTPFATIEDFVERGSALVGSPEQIVDKLHRFTEGFGQQLVGVSVDNLPDGQGREQLAWFAQEVAPALRQAHPDTLWAQPAPVAA
jgi:alkanesulfonate monooxygenase SsuD/methylene tetrahydromethanopterin reductase-like flavin-dependent oxidoreductase (luciferase family)